MKNLAETINRRTTSFALITTLGISSLAGCTSDGRSANSPDSQNMDSSTNDLKRDVHYYADGTVLISYKLQSEVQSVEQFSSIPAPLYEYCSAGKLYVEMRPDSGVDKVYASNEVNPVCLDNRITPEDFPKSW